MLTRVVTLVAVLLASSDVSAFCGFYVAGADSEIFNNATMVVMLRDGTTTVLSMQNDYQGPAEDFAMVVPVPSVLGEDNVRTLPREVFDRVDTLAAPRLVEYWEQDPCSSGIGLGRLGTIGHGGGGASGSGYGRGAGSLQVRVEAEFAVGEYEIVILSAEDSSDLEAWLRQNGYSIPVGAEAALQPYVEQGMKFFVAKVDVSKVNFDGEAALLSPLRIHYESDTFSLPVRLGMLNSSGTQDLVVHTLGRAQRFELANYENVSIPTNLDVADATRDRFGEFYAALFDETLARHPGAVVTEYAWQATGCDPCPGPVLSVSDLVTLGADVASGAVPQPAPTGRPARPEVGPGLSPEVVRRIFRRHRSQMRRCMLAAAVADPSITFQFTVSPSGEVEDLRSTGAENSSASAIECLEGAVAGWTFPRPESGPVEVTYPFSLARLSGGGTGRYTSFVLTRLHYRYGQGDLGEDLVFRAATGIVGGREGLSGEHEHGAAPSHLNNFQGRYVIRHAWTGAVECENPERGVWGGNPEAGSERPTPQAASRPANAARGASAISTFVPEGIPALESVATPVEPPAENTSESTEPASEERAVEAGGCGSCNAAPRGETSSSMWLVLLALSCVWRTRRRRARSIA